MRLKPSLLFTLVLIFTNLHAAAQVSSYTFPATLPASNFYQVSSGAQPLFVYDNSVASFTSFDLNGPATITVKAHQDIKWVDIRPQNLHIKYTFEDSTIKIWLEKPCKISVELNGKLENPLFVFANAPRPASKSGSDKPNIIFSAGKEYNIDQQVLKSGDHVLLEGGAVVHGAFKAENSSDITIEGNGILDGSGNNDHKGKYWKGIDLRHCKHINIRDIVMSNGTSWELVNQNCDSVQISNVKILSHGDSDDGVDIVLSRNVVIDNCFIRTKDDCIAIKAFEKGDSTSIMENILVKNCTIWNGPWGNGFEIGFELVAPEVRNITVKDCDIIHIEKGTAMSIHNGDKSDVHDITFDNIRVEDARGKLFDFAIFLSKYSVDGPKTEAEVQARYLHGVWDNVLTIAPEAWAYHAAYRGQVHDVRISNIYLKEGIHPFSIINGFDKQHPVKNVSMRNINVYGKPLTSLDQLKLFSANAEGITIR